MSKMTQPHVMIKLFNYVDCDWRFVASDLLHVIIINNVFNIHFNQKEVTA